MRKAKPKIRITLPDPKFGDELVTKFVNNMMYAGKKSTAYRIFYEAMEIVAERSKEDPVDVWKKGLANVTPAVEVRSRRIGGATFQIPSEIRAGRKMSIGMKNLISFSRKRHEKTMGQKLAGEILAAYKEEGSAYKRKEDTHRMAEANKAFSHFRF
ncbi:MAG: 30S ribosomal protein S7 [Bacteroidetes bacterium CG18_big_fil_WC_8_21_14_2_50_41_14]|nr:MAG: 30S ribosomal protein S7 [Bacteroidetes bacterium CG18_big_fil_WC_8_21_14_2_50_41_14]PJB59067.1 MAG: 30S ribosomal protein S7 [Bacteroidetes bacterium CG_4_9_14_3_um_filter_41_19]